MRTFEHFPKESICPICGTNNDKETILIPIAEKKEDGESCVQAQPFHADCIQKNMWYYESQGFVVIKTNF